MSSLIHMQEVDDMPPNPNQQLSNPRVAPRTKVCFCVFFNLSDPFSLALLIFVKGNVHLTLIFPNLTAIFIFPFLFFK